MLQLRANTGTGTGAVAAPVQASVRASHRPALQVRRSLIDFHRTHYSANLISVAVLGREDLDTLARWAVPLFAAVPDKGFPPPTFPFPPYPPECRTHVYQANTCERTRRTPLGCVRVI